MEQMKALLEFKFNTENFTLTANMRSRPKLILMKMHLKQIRH
jgi:hypothetical protein